MNEQRIAAAILTFALWNSREKSTTEQMSDQDWELLVTDYVRILGELIRRSGPSAL